MIIDSFTGEYRFLSNFYPSRILPPTLEHHYQASKTTDVTWYRRIMACPTAGAAKRMGRRAPLWEGWDDEFRLGFMRSLIGWKFSDPELEALLVATDGAELVEGNYWGDTFWGVCKGKGHNHLGTILMERRAIAAARLKLEVNHGQ